MSNEPFRVRIGGLFRCCMQTLDVKAAEGSLKGEEGERVTCLYCKKETMVFHDGAYQWVGPDAEPKP